MMVMRKGKALPIGTVREWGGTKYKKINNKKWSPVPGSRKPAKSDREPIEKGTGPGQKPLQPVNTLEEVYSLVEASQAEFSARVESIVEKYKSGVVSVIARKELKKKDRAARKITDTEGANALLDIDGKTIVMRSEKDVLKVAKFLHGIGEVVRMKDRFARPTNVGYRDFLCNMRMSNGAVVELQLTTEPLLEAKKHGHLFYEIEDQVDTAFKTQTISAEMFDTIRQYTGDSQRKLYDHAYELTRLGASFSASPFDIEVPLKSISAILHSEGAAISVLSEKTRKVLLEMLSKATTRSSQSKNDRLGESKVGLVIKTPLLKSSIIPAGEGVKDLHKAKPYPDGTIRTHGGRKMKKTQGGWIPVSEGKTRDEMVEEEKAPKKKPDKEILKIKGTPDMYQVMREIADGKSVYMDDVSGAKKKIYNSLTKDRLITWNHVAKDEYKAALTPAGERAMATGEALEIKKKRTEKEPEIREAKTLDEFFGKKRK